MRPVIAVPRGIALDARLSLEAKGLLLVLLSVEELPDGVLDQYSSQIKQLFDEGYLVTDGADFTLNEEKLWGKLSQPTELPQVIEKKTRPSKDLSMATRIRILERDGFRCRYCRDRAITLDHLKPRSQGGSNEDSNLVACCVPCNSRKGPRTPHQAGMVVLEVEPC